MSVAALRCTLNFRAEPRGGRCRVIHDLKRFRYLQGRNRAVQLAHHGSDAGGARVRLQPQARWPARTTQEIAVRLYGSLAFTGVGHGTDRAILAGSRAPSPKALTPTASSPPCSASAAAGAFAWPRARDPFDEPMQLLFMHHERLPGHSNGMRFSALGSDRRRLREEDYYSVGVASSAGEEQRRARRVSRACPRTLHLGCAVARPVP